MSLFLQKIPPKILIYLAKQKEPITINDISFGLKISQAHVSITIAKFEADGIISCVSSGHSKLIQLTEKGKKAASCTKALMSVVKA